MNIDISRVNLWQHFEDKVKCVIIIWTNTHVCILKAYDPERSHFIGLMESIKSDILPIDVVKKYAFSGRPCYLYEIFDELNFIKSEYWKLTDETLVWAPPICSNLAKVKDVLCKTGLN